MFVFSKRKYIKIFDYLYRSLENSTRKMDELSFELKQVDAKVEKYRTTFEKFVMISIDKRFLFDFTLF